MNEQKISIDILKNATDIICESCGNDVFEEIIKIKKVSKLITGGIKDTIIPMPIFACKKCGNINKDFDVK